MNVFHSGALHLRAPARWERAGRRAPRDVAQACLSARRRSGRPDARGARLSGSAVDCHRAADRREAEPRLPLSYKLCFGSSQTETVAD